MEIVIHEVTFTPLWSTDVTKRDGKGVYLDMLERKKLNLNIRYISVVDVGMIVSIRSNPPVYTRYC